MGMSFQLNQLFINDILYSITFGWPVMGRLCI
jgi:hypothetical protein